MQVRSPVIQLVRPVCLECHAIGKCFRSPLQSTLAPPAPASQPPELACLCYGVKMSDSAAVYIPLERRAR